MKWLSFIIYVFTTAFSPGPNNCASMSNMAKTGIKKGMPFNFGLFASQILLMGVCVAFCSWLEKLLPSVEKPMRFIGAAYILYLAWKTYTSETDISSDKGGGFKEGFLLNSFNVKYLLYCVVSLESYMIPAYPDNTFMVSIMAFALCLVAFLSNFLWGVLGTAFGRIFSNHSKLFNTIMALMLVCCAVSIIL